MDKRYKIDWSDDRWYKLAVYTQYLTVFGNLKWKRVHRCDDLDAAYRWISEDKRMPIYV